MSTEVATFDRVKAAAVALRGAGEKVTADTVISHIGGGSKATVLKHLKILRSESDAQQTLPPGVLEIAMPALSALFEAGVKTEAERVSAQSARQVRMMDELESQVEELASEVIKLSEQLGDSKIELSKMFDKYEASKRELTEARADLKRVDKEAAKDRDEFVKRLGHLMSKFEATLATKSEL